MITMDNVKLLIFLFAVVAIFQFAAARPLKQPTLLPAFSCLSWRLAVETNNIRDWSSVPRQCGSYVSNYMQSKQYEEDCNAVAVAASNYSRSIKLGNDGKDIWVFDIDDTALSNLLYYARPDVSFGAKPRNWTLLEEWFKSGKAPAVRPTLGLYKYLIAKGFKIVFMSGVGEMYRTFRESNLKKAGYTTWEKLILKSESERGMSSKVFKSKNRKEVEDAGYRIIGNVGDQWSDLIGTNVGKRTFKLPNPMYYVA